MTTVVIDELGVERFLRSEFTTRARAALALYRRQPLERDKPGYPFAQRPEDGSIRDRSSASVRPIPGGVRVTVESRGAPFIEGGNDAGGSFIDAGPGGHLALPLRRRRGGGRIVVGADGRPYLLVQRVRTYRGRHLLERSVREAFGGRSSST